LIASAIPSCDIVDLSVLNMVEHIDTYHWRSYKVILLTSPAAVNWQCWPKSLGGAQGEENAEESCDLTPHDSPLQVRNNLIFNYYYQRKWKCGKCALATSSLHAQTLSTSAFSTIPYT